MEPARQLRDLMTAVPWILSIGLAAFCLSGCTTPSLVKQTCAHETIASFQALLNRVDPTNASGDYDLFRFVLEGELEETVRRFIEIREAGTETPEALQQSRELDLFFEMGDTIELWPEQRDICQAEPLIEAQVDVVVFEPTTLMAYDLTVTLRQLGSRTRSNWVITEIAFTSNESS